MVEPLWQVARHYVIIVMWQKADLDFRPHFFIYHETGNLPTLCNNYLLCSGHFVHMLPEILSLAVPLKTSASLIAIFIDEHIKVMSRSSHFSYRFWAMEDHSERWAARCRNRRKCEETLNHLGREVGEKWSQDGSWSVVRQGIWPKETSRMAFRMLPWAFPGGQRTKDPVLSPLGLWSLLWHRFDPWPGQSCMLQMWTEKKKKERKKDAALSSVVYIGYWYHFLNKM